MVTNQCPGLGVLTKHCTGCGRNLGMNAFVNVEDGTFNELCRACQPKKP